MILTNDYLKNEAKKIPIEKRLLFENKIFNSEKIYDIFLSHSFYDKDIIDALYDKFNECGYTVFIDWKEEVLSDRSKVSKEVANKLKIYMNCSKGLLYVATSNSTNSKWCPWELGYVDGKKERVAILPILQNKPDSGEYGGQEYLGIYPYLTYSPVEDENRYDFFVHDPCDYNLYSTLKSWLNTGNLSSHKK